MMYAKTLINKTDFYCLRSNLFSFIDLKNTETCPEGYVEFQIVNEKPELQEGQVMAYHFVLEDNILKRTYIAISEEESKKSKYGLPRTFSKLKAVATLTKLGYWEECKKFIQDNGLYDLYLAAQDFKEDNEYFLLGLQQIKEKLGLTDEQIESILSQIIAD